MSASATLSAGLHHITAIASDAAANLAFYTRVLGLRLVKKTVNFDDPGTYHLYYGDEAGSPGTILTFFPWADAAPGRAGHGLAMETAFAVPRSAIGFWVARFAALAIDHDAPLERFGETVIAFRDPDGMRLELVGGDDAGLPPGRTADGIPAEHAFRGFAGVTLWTADAAQTAAVLEQVLGWKRIAEEPGRIRFAAPASGLATTLDLKVETGQRRGTMGAGSIHHVAFRAADDAAQAAMAEALTALGGHPTEQKDRNYFRSIYFREPGGVIFEIATDDPGFAVDEDRAHLGEKLMLPPWLEPRRAVLEATLPNLQPEAA